MGERGYSPSPVTARKSIRYTLVAIVLIFGSPALAAEVESPLVFDLANNDAVVDEHTAQLLWNLSTDNIVAERVDTVTGWNSLYLEEPGAISGTVTADLDAGTISGEIVERWVCSNDCLSSTGTPSWTTTRDTGWTAVITDGIIEPGPDGWVITGSAAIRYNSAVTSVETASDCGGTPCYMCKDQLCVVGGEAVATVPLEGWIDGETLSLAFVDQLQSDASTMDLSDLRRTEFFMSRFSFTMTGAIAPIAAKPPPGEPADPAPEPAETDTPSAEAGTVDLPAGDPVPGVIAGSPPGEFGDDAPAQAPAETKPSKPGMALVTFVALLVLSGIAVALIVGFVVRWIMGWKARDAAADASRDEGLAVDPNPNDTWIEQLREGSERLSAAQEDVEPASPTGSSGSPPKPPSKHQSPTYKSTPSEHHAKQAGLKSGRYRWTEFPEPVYLERLDSTGLVELVTSQFRGPALLGDPDPATPGRTPVFSSSGEEIGWVRTPDVPE